MMSAIGEGESGRGWRILIVGTGGQGVLTAAKLLCDCFVERGHCVVSGQLHGMAQRGGAVQSSVMIDCGACPVIPSGRADFVVGFEPVETARALPLMSSDSVVFMNTTPVLPYILAQRTVLEEDDSEYPDVGGLVEAVLTVAPRTFAFDASRWAVDAGSVKALNIVMIGCVLGLGSLPCTADEFWEIVSGRIPPALREANTTAFWKGAEFAKDLQLVGRSS